jgi:hypothetical protein
MDWLVLVYTIPPHPSRLRALIWRRLKELGVTYLRDGVCVLPHQAAAHAGLQAVTAKVREFGGQATLVQHAELDPATVQLVHDQARESRRLEYAALIDAATNLTAHVEHERRHRDLQPPELRGLTSDLSKLRRWHQQITARDYFVADSAAAASEALLNCEAALAEARQPEPVL